MTATPQSDVLPGANHLVSPVDVGQATAIEQSRAIAEVQGAIIVAQRCPRSLSAATQQMTESCGQLGLAERAFFRFPRAGQQVSGPSVHLARELARCWGNVQYGIAELRRDDVKGESEMIAFAWDVQTNTRASSTFIVKHARDTSKGRKDLTELRDVYENNANAGARRLREQIFAILPKWFVEDAKARCIATIEKGAGDEPLPARIAKSVRAFGDLGISAEQLERKVGRRPDAWTAHDLVTLTVVGRSLRNGETTVEAEFPDDIVTVAEVLAAPSAAPSAVPASPAPARRAPRAQAEKVAAPPAAEVTEDGPTDEDIAALNAEAARDADAVGDGPLSALFGGGS